MPSPALSSDSDSLVVEFLKPSATKKWNSLPSWEKHIEMIDTVERADEELLFIYFKLKGEKKACKENSSVCADKFPCKLLKFYESKLVWAQAEDLN